MTSLKKKALLNFAEVPEGLNKAQNFDLLINTDGRFT